jgi:ATP-binding cassette, subfamily B, bacterial
MRPKRTGAGGLTAAFALVIAAAPLTAASYVVTAGLSYAAPVVSALLIRLLVNDLTGHSSTAALAWLSGGIALCGALMAGLSRVSGYQLRELARRTGLIADDRIYQAINALNGLARFEDPAFLDQVRMAQQAGAGTCAQLAASVVNIVCGVLASVGYVGVLLTISPLLAAALAVSGGAILLAEMALARSRAATLAEISRRARRELFFGSMLVSAAAAKEIRLFGIGAFVRGRMRAEKMAANDRAKRMDLREARLIGGLNLLAAVVAGAGLFWGVHEAAIGRLNIGDVVLFVQAVTGLQSGLAGTVREVASVQESRLMTTHYRAVIETRADLESGSREPLLALSSGIELEDVWFRYSPVGPWVLRGVDLVLPRGRITALVGKNGSGKSTLVKLLGRFYDPDRGAIYWDGRDLRDIPPAELRERMAAVFQDYVEYDLSLAENIAVGDISRAADQDAIVAAGRYAGIDEAARVLPRGYGTLLSRMFLDEKDKTNPETGVLLSGGQWQRIALARAWLRGARDLIVLDEPSAGLDAEAEQELQLGIRDRCVGQTLLLISHRLNTLIDADQIVVLSAGQVTERGTHRSLLQAGGEYARLFKLQAQGYRLPELSGCTRIRQGPCAPYVAESRIRIALR